MKSISILEKVVSVTSTSGPKTVMIPAGAYFMEAKDNGSGTLKMKRGTAAIFESGQPQFSRELSPVGTVQRTFPETYIEFSSGAGIVYAESMEENFPAIWVSPDNTAIAAAVALPKTF
jgi:hypothetical protein